MRELVFDDGGSTVRWTDVSGRLPARVFIHGLGGTGAAVYGDFASDPALGGHRSLVVDLPGHGLSDRPTDFDYTLDEHAAVILAICRAEGLEGIDLVGHSLGADISVVVAGRNPGLVGRLVVSEPNLDPLPRSTTGRASQAIASMSEEEFVASGYREIVEKNPGWAPTGRLCAPHAIYRSAVGLITGTEPTMRTMLTGLQIPRTFIRGENGEPLLDAEGLIASGVDVVTIPNAGHMMMFDAPAAFARALASALGVGSSQAALRPGSVRS